MNVTREGSGPFDLRCWGCPSTGSDVNNSFGTSVIFNDSFLSPNGSDSGSRVVPEPPVYILVAATIAYVIIFVLGVLGNVLVVATVFYGRNLRHSVNLYLVNLCLADLLVLFICMPTVLVELHAKEVWYFGHFLCKLVPFLESVVASASVFTIIAISIERYRVVWKPFTVVNTPSNNLHCYVTIVIWAVSVAINAPLLTIIKFKASRLLDGTPIKVCRTPITNDVRRAYIVSLYQVSFFLPCLLLAGMYARLCCRLMPSSHSPIELAGRTFQDKSLIRRQVVNTIASIVLVFFLCHLPYRVLALWIIFASKQAVRNLGFEGYLNVLYTARVMFYLNHALNPIVYNFVSRRFRGTLRLMFVSRGSHRREYSSRRRILEGKSPFVNSNKYGDGRDAMGLKMLDRKKASSTSSSDSQRQRMNDFCLIYKNIAERGGGIAPPTTCLTPPPLAQT